MNLFERLQPVSTLVFDVDGVLTDGTLLVLPNNVMARRMNIKDGYALQLAVKKGYKVVIISGGNSPEVMERLHNLGVKDVYMQVADKVAVLGEYLQKNSLEWGEVLYMGDDIPDFKVMQMVGFPCCPADAATEIRQLSVYISPVNGGFGCGRDIIEKVLRLNGHWNEDTTIRAK